MRCWKCRQPDRHRHRVKESVTEHMRIVGQKLGNCSVASIGYISKSVNASMTLGKRERIRTLEIWHQMAMFWAIELVCISQHIPCVPNEETIALFTRQLAKCTVRWRIGPLRVFNRQRHYFWVGSRRSAARK